MAAQRDFDIVLPTQALAVRSDSLPPSVRQHFKNTGVAHPADYNHYQIRILFQHRWQRETASPDWWTFLRSGSRNKKRRSLQSADVVEITLASENSNITFREVYPPTITDNGDTVYTVGGGVELGVGLQLPVAQASAKLQASAQKQFRNKTFAVISQRSNTVAVWEFHRLWLQQNYQPELHIACSIRSNLPAQERYLWCYRKAADGSRILFAPRKPSKIFLE